MRYILKDGYIDEISFGATIECKNQTCTEYTGSIPTGYASLQEWASKEIDKLNAWKIVEGNLVFDNAKYLELKELWEKQAEDNRPVYHKEIFEMKQQIEDISDISESQYQKATATGKVITVDNVKKAYPKVKITDINPYSFSKVDLIATGKNQLKNEAVVQKINGVNFTPNKDRSITIQGTTATSKTATGTNIEITGGDLTSIDIYNNFVQETRSGKNLFIPLGSKTVSGITVTENNDGTYNISGTATSNIEYTNFISLDNSKVINGETYILSSNKDLLAGLTARIEMYNGSNWLRVFVASIGAINKTQTGIANTTNATRVRFGMFISSGTTLDIKNIGFQLEKGSTATDYESYGISPSPDFPSEIKNVDNIQFAITGKNLEQGIEQGGISTTGNNYSSTTAIRSKYYNQVEPNTTYALSMNNVFPTGFNVTQYDENKNFISFTYQHGKVTTAENTRYIRLSKTATTNDKVQIEKGSVATEYEPYQSQTIDVDLEGNKLCSKGDLKDILSISADGTTELNKKLGEKVFNGTENWTLQSINSHDIANFQIYFDGYVGGESNLAICDTFNPQTSLIADETNEGFYLNSNKFLFIRIKKSRCSTVEEFKNWLSTHNLTFVYELATPEFIDLSPVEELYLYEGTNYITNNENADMEVKYTINKEIEYNIAGTSSNTSAFLCFKKGINYYLSGLENQKIKMYYFNGTDRTEIYSGTGGAIKFTDSDKLVTQIVLVTGGSSSKLTIYPMLVIGTSAAPYETYTSSMLSIDFKEYIESGFFLGSNTFLGNNAFLKGTNINYILIEKNNIYVSVNGEEHKIGSGNVILFDGYDVLYTMQDTTLEVNYCINALEVDNLDFMRGKKTTTNKFKVLTDGSIEAHDGNFSGTVTATAGKIGGCEIADGKLQVPSANISGTLSADKINGGTINASNINLEGVSLSPNASKLGGWSASSNRLYSNSSKVASSLYSNGNFILGGNYGMVKFDTNPVRITTADKLLISDNYSASEMANSNDTISIRAFSGTVHINSNYGVYAGSNRLDGSSSRAIKENIKPIDPKYVDEIYKEVNKMPLYTYDYLDKYGDKDDFGFIIEDIENTCLNRTLKINKNPDDEKVKNYGTLELNKMNLLLIKELMKKNEELENRIKELERKC